jgi:hypothetical protein
VPNRFTMSLYPDQISCPSQRACWALGAIVPTSSGDDVTVVVRSTDGGEHWRIVPTPYYQPFAISCSSADDCWMGGDGISGTGPGMGGFRANPNGTISPIGNAEPTLWHTTDGGRTWHQTAVTPPKVAPGGTSPSSLQGIGQISCPTRRICVALGQGDGGARYTASYTNFP